MYPTSYHDLISGGYPEESTAPYPPGPTEARCFYYGLHSRPRLVARSSAYVWDEPCGIETYLIPKDLSPLDYDHPLRKIWESQVGPAMVAYLDAQQVQWTSLDPVRIGYFDTPSHPAIIWIGVKPDSINNEQGVPIAVNCKKILDAHGMEDVHVEIRHSEVFLSAGPKMYPPASTSEPVVQAREPFSTTLGLPISREQNPSVEGTGGFFVSDARHPGKLYLVTARHVLFPPDMNANELYQHQNVGQPHINVLIFGEAAIEKYTKAIKAEICYNQFYIKHHEGRDRHSDPDEIDDELERDESAVHTKKYWESIDALKTLLADVTQDWQDQENRILGHVTLSPPIAFGIGEDGSTEDWAVVELDTSKIDATNFLGNAIDLGPLDPFMKTYEWLNPFPDTPYTFDLYCDSRLPFRSTIPDAEMWKPGTGACDDSDDPYLLVMKRGHGSDITVGRLNTIRSFTRFHGGGQLGQTSKDLAVLPRSAKWVSPFSELGDSGSAVIDGKGRLAGLLTAGAGTVESFDCSYLTSANFIFKRMAEHGLEATLPPVTVA